MAAPPTGWDVRGCDRRSEAQPARPAKQCRRPVGHHWFVRWTVATAAGLALGILWLGLGLSEGALQSGQANRIVGYLAACANLCTLLVPTLTLGIFVYDRVTSQGTCRMDARCLTCGYLLRGLPERRCPECGTDF